MYTQMRNLTSSLDIIVTEKEIERDGSLPPVEVVGRGKPDRRCEWEVEPCSSEATMFYDVSYTPFGYSEEHEYDKLAGIDKGRKDKFRPGAKPDERIERICLCPCHFVYRMRSLLEITMFLAYKGNRNLDDFVVGYGFLTDPHSATREPAAG